MHCSASPKLCEMTSPMWWSTTYFVVARRSASLLLAASASTMFAPGAMAWAHRTSSVISSAQPTMFAVVRIERRDRVRLLKRREVRRIGQAERAVLEREIALRRTDSRTRR